MVLIYLAFPYNHPLESVRTRRFEEVCSIAAHLMRKGIYIFSPIAHTHPIALAGDLPRGWEYWKTYDEVMIRACDELWIVTLDGWEESQGIKGEIEIAQSLGKVIKYVEPQFCYLSDMP